MKKHDLIRGMILIASISAVIITTVRKWLFIYKDPQGYAKRERERVQQFKKEFSGGGGPVSYRKGGPPLNKKEVEVEEADCCETVGIYR